MSMNNSVALLLHYFPSFTIESVLELSYRQILLFLDEISNINELFMGSPKKGKDKEPNESDFEAAKALGCKNVGELKNGR